MELPELLATHVVSTACTEAAGQASGQASCEVEEASRPLNVDDLACLHEKISSTSASQLDGRLAGIETHVAALQDVPRQLGQILEDVRALQAHLAGKAVQLPQLPIPGTSSDLRFDDSKNCSANTLSPTGGPLSPSKLRSSTMSSISSGDGSRPLSKLRPKDMPPLIGQPAQVDHTTVVRRTSMESEHFLLAELRRSSMSFGQDVTSNTGPASNPRSRRCSMLSSLRSGSRNLVPMRSTTGMSVGESVVFDTPAAGPPRSGSRQLVPKRSTTGMSVGESVAFEKFSDGPAVVLRPNQDKATSMDPVIPNTPQDMGDDGVMVLEDGDCCKPQNQVRRGDTITTGQPMEETLTFSARGSGGRNSVSSAQRDSVTSGLSLGGSESRTTAPCPLLSTTGLGEEAASKWVQHPNAQWRFYWEIFMVFLTVGVAGAVSVALCYDGYHGLEATMGSFYVIFLNTVSGLWLADIALTFCTGFYQGQKVVLCPSKIAWRYFSGWLFPDLLTAMPVVCTGYVAAALSSLKLVRLFRLGPLLAGRTPDNRLLGLPARMGITVFLATVFLTAFWRLSLWADESILDIPRDTSEQWWQLFVADMYWVIMTMSTVGFGDIAPIGVWSRLFAILAMLVAPIFFGTVVSILTHVTQSIFNDEVSVQVGEANRFMRQRRLPVELQRRVEHNLRRQILQERTTLKPAIFGKLSTAVQREISLELLRGSVLDFPLFRGVLHSFIAEIAQAHKWVQCSRGDLVVEEGQLMQEVVFVIRGRLLVRQQAALGEMDELSEEEVVEQDGQELNLNETELGTGAWFGEPSLFCNDKIRVSTVYAAVDSELAVLQSCDYHRIVQKYPRLLKRHHGIAKALQLGTVSLKDLEYRPREEDIAGYSAGAGARSISGWLRSQFSSATNQAASRVSFMSRITTIRSTVIPDTAG